MAIKRRLSGAAKPSSKPRKLKPASRVRTLEDYLERIPDLGTPDARIKFKDMINEFVVPFKSFQYQGFSVTVYPNYQSELKHDSPYVRITAVQVGFQVRERPQEVMCRLKGDRRTWSTELNMTVVRLRDSGLTPRNKS